MSGLLDRIVRRRRASASSRLGPPSFNGNGASARPLALTQHVNGSAPIAALAPPEPEVIAPPEPEPAVPQPEPQLLDLAPETVEFPSVHDAPAITEPDPEPAPPEPEPEPEAEAEPEPDAQAEPAPETPGFLERGRIRRRVRYLSQLRELQLRDLGGFLVELGRFGRERPELVEAKVQSALRTDAELRSLELVLGAEEPLREIREAGIGGACMNCGAVHGSGDRYCASCGEPIGRPR